MLFGLPADLTFLEKFMAQKQEEALFFPITDPF